jgi:hypothetical protein
MKAFIFLISVIFIPTFSFAGDLEAQINKACLRHAISLVSNLKTEVIGELSDDKSAQVLKLATDSCQAYFKKEFNQQTTESIAAANNNEQEEGGTDWFTEKILSGDIERKEGNKRLKNLKH